MTPEELLRQGKPEDCLAAVEKLVRANPADGKLRVMLFQVLCVLGQWDRAQNQLQVCAGMISHLNGVANVDEAVASYVTD